MYPETIIAKAEPGFREAMFQASAQSRLSPSEWMRSRLRAAMEAEGVNLPPFPARAGIAKRGRSPARSGQATA